MKKLLIVVLTFITFGFGLFAQGVSGNSKNYDAETFENEKTKTHALRLQIVHAETIQAYKDIFKDYI